jgi:3D (Asp-Asp-Asp) domain-containing protein
MRQAFMALFTAIAVLVAGVSAAEEGRGNVTTRVEVEKIPYSVHYEFSRNVGAGRVVKIRNGADGEIRRTFEVTLRDGKAVGRKLVSTDRTEPVDAVFHMGREGLQASRGGPGRFVRGAVKEMIATAYDPSPQTIGPRATGRTRTGMIATYGHVAVDPRVIPLGTLVFVEGYGFAIASDTGGAIKGNKIDLCFDTRAEALRFGRRKVRVHILKPTKNQPRVSRDHPRAWNDYDDNYDDDYNLRSKSRLTR